MNDRSSSILNVDKERQQINIIVNFLFHDVLHQYIAYVNRRDVVCSLYEFFEKSEVTIISKQQLKVYQELEKTIINTSFLKE